MIYNDILVTTSEAVKASASTNLTGANNDLSYEAADGGAAGNDITITYHDPAGNNAVLGVVVAGSDITVNLATDGSGVITTIASDIVAAIAASAPAHALVIASNKTGNVGTGLVTAMASMPLSGGVSAHETESSSLAPFQLAAVQVIWDAAAPAGSSVVVANQGRTLLTASSDSANDIYALRTAAVNNANAAIAGSCVPYVVEGPVSCAVTMGDDDASVEPHLVTVRLHAL